MMVVTDGLMTFQVLQRNSNGVGQAHVKGTCSGDFSGKVTVRIEKGNETLLCTENGKVLAGNWEAEVQDLPVGGPYKISFTIGDETVTINDILVGDVWFLGGQSNMEGIGNVEGALSPDPMIHAFYQYDEWDIAEEPLHLLESAVDPVHCQEPLKGKENILKSKKAKLKGVGPGLAFGLEMLERTGIPQGLVCCAHGGTSMDQWSPDKKSEQGNSFYGAMLRRFVKLGQPIAGMLWYQGCSDTGCADEYTVKMEYLVKSVREDFSLPDLPWMTVQIGKFYPLDDNPYSPGWMSIREQQRLLPEKIANLSVVPAIDLPMDDGIHIAATGHVTLAKRLARTACYRLKLDEQTKDGIDLDRIKFVASDYNRGADVIEVSFKNVSGSLKCEGVPAGFRLIDANGKMTRRIHKMIPAGNKVILEAYLDNNVEMTGCKVAYGYEIDAYCNFMDDEMMGLPAFAPHDIEPADK
jgi:sialate O-acetylesterase